MSGWKNFKYLNISILTIVLAAGLFFPFYGLIFGGVTYFLQKQKILRFSQEDIILLWGVLFLLSGYYIVNLIYTIKYLIPGEEASAFFLFVF